MDAHSPECRDFNFFFHAATGGDGECVCHLYPDLIAQLYFGVMCGRLTQHGLKTETEYMDELAVFGDYIDLPAWSEHGTG